MLVRPDGVSIDDHIFEALSLDNMLKSSLDKVEYLSELGIQVERISQDTHRVNNYGNHLLEFCSANGICICNGRVGSDKDVG